MEVKLYNLVGGTIFAFDSKVYRMESDLTYDHKEDHIGTGKSSFRAAPWLGGQFQTKIPIFIGTETNVWVIEDVSKYKKTLP